MDNLPPFTVYTHVYTLPPPEGCRFSPPKPSTPQNPDNPVEFVSRSEINSPTLHCVLRLVGAMGLE